MTTAAAPSAAPPSKELLCASCNKSVSISKCEGCQSTFCQTDLNEHRQQLNKEREKVTGDFDTLQQTLTTYRHPLMDKIDEWENESIDEIKKTAEQARRDCLNLTTSSTKSIGTDGREVREKMQQVSEFDERDLTKWKAKLDELKRTLSSFSCSELCSIELIKMQTPFIFNIHLTDRKEASSNSSAPICQAVPPTNDTATPSSAIETWSRSGRTVAGGNGRGSDLNQFCDPRDIFVDESDGTLFIADAGNDRVIEWEEGDSNGIVVAGGRGQGFEPGQLFEPIGVAVDREGSLFITDGPYDKRRVTCWQKGAESGRTLVSTYTNLRGILLDPQQEHFYVAHDWEHCVVRYAKDGSARHVVAGGYGRGDALNQLHFPNGVAIDDSGTVYVSDSGNHRIVKWPVNAQEGILVAGGNGEGNGEYQLNWPDGILVDPLGTTVYVADRGNHRVVRISCKNDDVLPGKSVVVVGGDARGDAADQLHSPIDLAFDSLKNLYVLDSGNGRVQMFLNKRSIDEVDRAGH